MYFPSFTCNFNNIYKSHPRHTFFHPPIVFVYFLFNDKKGEGATVGIKERERVTDGQIDDVSAGIIYSQTCEV